MLSITIPAGSTLKYHVPALEINRWIPQVQVDFQDGSHTFKSADFELGTITHAGVRALVGRIVFGYTFNAAARTITVSGTEFSSNDTMVLLMPGAETVFRKMVRDTNELLIHALKQQGQLVVRIRTPFPSLTTEHYLSLCTVSQNGKPLGFYDASKDYGADAIIGNFESTWGGEVYMHFGENFSNVIGSTGDPKIAGLTWVQLWANQFGFYTLACTSQNYNGFPCSNNIIGGHFFSGQVAQTVAVDSNDVYIYPICQTHNTNNNVYMAALTYLNGVWLNNYQQR
ncbi:hypothetical protein F25303_13808 [Fusarium sp. NRRL 25303]|nr:hypothetical protein F25303_13808 [Fusarium sp. NRRL 25303]